MENNLIVNKINKILQNINIRTFVVIKNDNKDKDDLQLLYLSLIILFYNSYNALKDYHLMSSKEIWTHINSISQSPFELIKKIKDYNFIINNANNIIIKFIENILNKIKIKDNDISEKKKIYNLLKYLTIYYNNCNNRDNLPIKCNSDNNINNDLKNNMNKINKLMRSNTSKMEDKYNLFSKISENNNNKKNKKLIKKKSNNNKIKDKNIDNKQNNLNNNNNNNSDDNLININNDNNSDITVETTIKNNDNNINLSNNNNANTLEVKITESENNSNKLEVNYDIKTKQSSEKEINIKEIITKNDNDNIIDVYNSYIKSNDKTDKIIKSETKENTINNNNNNKIETNNINNIIKKNIRLIKSKHSKLSNYEFPTNYKTLNNNHTKTITTKHNNITNSIKIDNNYKQIKLIKKNATSKLLTPYKPIISKNNIKTEKLREINKIKTERNKLNFDINRKLSRKQLESKKETEEKEIKYKLLNENKNLIYFSEKKCKNKNSIQFEKDFITKQLFYKSKNDNYMNNIIDSNDINTLSDTKAINKLIREKKSKIINNNIDLKIKENKEFKDKINMLHKQKEDEELKLKQKELKEQQKYEKKMLKNKLDYEKKELEYLKNIYSNI